MGIGAAMTGGNPKEGRQKDDFYPTPSEVTRALLARLTFGPGLVLEPAAGDYRMASDIEGAGYSVQASDIAPRDDRVAQGDFFAMTETRASTVITNPPFSLAQRFIEHSLDTLKVQGLALLLKSTFWHAARRSALFERHPPSHICALTWRPDFLNKGGPTMDCSWFVWLPNRDGTTRYLLLKRPT